MTALVPHASRSHGIDRALPEQLPERLVHDVGETTKRVRGQLSDYGTVMDTRRRVFMSHSQPQCFLHRHANFVRIVSRTGPTMTRGTTGTISRSIVLGPDGDGCPRTICPDPTDWEVRVQQRSTATTPLSNTFGFSQLRLAQRG
jgi:hypothetical protein